MIFLRQSTASQEVPLGRFVDSTDGNTEETALSIANTDIKIWKTGATTLANKNSGGATHISNGEYYAVFDATDTDTIGPLKICIHVAGALYVQVFATVLDEAVYDAMFGTVALATATNITAGTITTTTNLTNLPAITSNWLTAAGLASDAVTEIRDAITGGAYALSTDANGRVRIVDGTGTGELDTASGLVTLTAASIAAINAEVDTALADIRLDELLAADSDIDGAAPPTVGSVFHELMTKTTGSFTYDQTTDSLEAIRDRGDAAWITATGFSTHSAADVWAVATRVLTAATNISGPIADQVWEETLADHSGTVGSTAEALNAAGAAGDPWTTSLPGAYGAGSAGYIIGNYITGNAYTRLGAPAGASVSADIAAVKSDTAAILVDTNELQTDWTNGGRLDTILDDILIDTGTTGVIVNGNGFAAATTTATLADLGSDALITLIATAVWSNLTTTTRELTSGTNIDGSTFTAIPWNASWDAEVQSEVQDAIEVNHLDHLLAVAAAGTECVNSSYWARLVSKSATPAFSSYANTTDSLEALRDRGDAAWVTATAVSLGTVAANVTQWAGDVVPGPDAPGYPMVQLAYPTTLVNLGVDYSGGTLVTDITGNLSGSVGSVTGAVGSLGATAQGNVRTAVGLASANLDTQLTAIDDYLDTEIATIISRIGVPSVSLAADIAALNDITAADVWAAATRTLTSGVNIPSSIWTYVVENSNTAEELLRGLSAFAMGKASGGGSAPVFRDLADTKNRISMTVDASGNRTAVTRDLT